MISRRARETAGGVGPSVGGATSTVGGAGFAAVLRRRDVAPLVAAAMLGRLPLGMGPLGLVLLLRAQHRSYAVAGAVVAAYSLGTALANPLLGRAVDRLGEERVLVPVAIGFSAFLGGDAAWIAWGGGVVGAVVLSALAGATLPPVGACMRAAWPRLVEAEDLRSAAYAFEATVQEVGFVAGPVLVAALASAVSPAFALGCGAACGSAGAVGFALAAARVGATVARMDGDRATAGPPWRSGALRSVGVRTVLLACVCLGVGFGAFEVAMPAFCERHGHRAAAGLAIGAFALGSLVGGIWATSAPPRRGQQRRYLLSVVGLGIALVPLLAAPSIAAVTLLALLGGTPIAPGFAAAYAMLDELAVPGTATETFAWVGTTVLGGAAAGTAFGGVLVRASGYRASLGLAIAGTGLAAAVAFARRRSLAVPGSVAMPAGGG